MRGQGTSRTARRDPPRRSAWPPGPPAAKPVPGFSKPAPTLRRTAGSAAKPPARRPPGGGGGRGGRGGRRVPSSQPASGTPSRSSWMPTWSDARSTDAAAATRSTNDRMMGFGPIALMPGARARSASRRSVQGPEPQDSNRRRSLAHFRMQRSATSTTPGAPPPPTSITTACRTWSRGHSIPGAGLHRAPRVHRGPHLQPEQQVPEGMVNFAYDYTGDGWPDISGDQRPIYPLRESQGRIAPLGPLQRGAAGDHRDRSVQRHRRRRQARGSVRRPTA